LKILILGVTTRAIAESAVRTQHKIVTLDYFGDRDQKEIVENYSLLRGFIPDGGSDVRFSAQKLLCATRRLGINADAIVYVSGLESFPDVLELLARDHLLLGNSPNAVRQVRTWSRLRTVCRETNIPLPDLVLKGEQLPPFVTETGKNGGLRWLHKPIHGSSGHGITFWDGQPLDETHMLQTWVRGRHASAAFVANGERCVVVGITEQLIGCRELGARGFAWCGNILPLAVPDENWTTLIKEIERVATILTQRFGLQGLNGVDLVVTDSEEGRIRPYLIEINPRYTASMELVELAYGINLFSFHLAALQGQLPRFNLLDRLGHDLNYWGKGIVYAHRSVVAPDTDGWRALNRRDVPFRGDRFDTGGPVCTVLACGVDRKACWNNLLQNVEAVRNEMLDPVHI
jgi:predicted ATP-grasp superfamily ATP-dependent carboligase